MSQPETSRVATAERRTKETKSFVPTVKAVARRKYTREEKICVVLGDFRREVINDN